jgi:hypothetical protein
LQADLTRTVDRLRTLGLARLEAGFAPEPTRADAARQVAQHLADVTADLEGRPRRHLPVLGVQASGDQLAVVGHDLLASTSEPGTAMVPSDLGFARMDSVEVDAVLLEAADLLLALRRRL